MRRAGFLFWFGSALILGGAALLALHSYDSLRSHSAQRKAKAWLNAEVATLPAPQTQARASGSAPAVRRGDVLGELRIDRLHMSVMVFEGDDRDILKIGAGHIPGTAVSPGNGNIGIAAHRDTFFRPLRLIRARDVITLRTASGTARFTVTETEIVRPTRVEVLDRAPGRDLTLVTCYPFAYMGRAPQRFIVHARKLA
jgi:sortase A